MNNLGTTFSTLKAKSLRILKNHYFLAFLIVAVGLILRLVKFDELASFAHDNSRDLIINYKMFYFHEWVYRGPVFSVIWGYLSPIYYYILFPFHLLFDFHPLSGAVLSGILGVVASLVAFSFLKKNVSAASGFIGLVLFSCSVYFLKHSLDGLNTSLLPPVALLSLFACYKVFLENKEKYLWLFAISFALLAALHPSGFFVLIPFILFSLFHKVKYTLKNINLSLLIFAAIGALPYLIQEKKLEWWTIKKVFGYLGTAGQGLISFSSLKNYFLVTLDNVSLGVFGSTNIVFLVLSVGIIVSLLIEGFLYFKRKTSYHFISCFVMVYYLSFGLLMKYKSLATNERWYFSVFIPLIYLYLAILLGKIFSKSRVFFVTLALLYFGSNFYTYITRTPKHETYYYEKLITERVLEDSGGSDLNIYGVNPEPNYYLMWYWEKDPVKKDQYFQWIKWQKSKNSTLVYYVIPKGKSITGYIEGLKKNHNLVGNYKSIYQLPDGNIIYRIN